MAALPAEKQVDAVAIKLQELNPEFDGKLTGLDGNGTPMIAKGMVTELGFVSDNVTDISPLRVGRIESIWNCRGTFVSGRCNGILSTFRRFKE